MSVIVHRLIELRNRHGQLCPRSFQDSTKMAELNSPLTRPSTPSFTSFFSLASETQELMATLLINIKKLSSERCKLYTITTPDEENRCFEALDVYTTYINKGLADVRESLQNLNELPTDIKDTSDTRIRSNVCTTLARRFRGFILQFQKEQSEIADAKRSRAIRLLQINTPGKLTFDDAERLVIEGITHNMAMNDRISHTETDLNWSIIRDRVEDLHALQKSISDLSQMFHEMATLSNQQGDVLDSIEFAVVNVKNFNNLSSKSLLVAKSKQRSNMKLILYIILTCIILAVVIILPILFTDALHKIFNGAKQR